MTTVKRVRPAVLFLVTAALLAGTPALAVGGWRPSVVHWSIELVCVAPLDDPDSGASGRARLDGYAYVDPSYQPFGGVSYFVDLKVTCAGLTPGETYSVYAKTGPWDIPNWPGDIVAVFTADKNGNGKAECSLEFANWILLYVVRDDDGTLVLSSQP